MLSIIIPTLNEEDYLPRLLASIAMQKFSDYEIIIADAGSTDATLEIAKKYTSIVTKGGLPGRARNNGAKVAKGELFFFLDADTVLSEDFLQKSLDEFASRKLSMASFCLHPYPEKKLSYFLMNTFYNKTVLLLENIWPYYAMGGLIKRDVFEKLKGFDETITLAEDMDLARRSRKFGAFGIIRSVELYFSDRRFVKEGWVFLGVKYFLCGLHDIFLGPIRSNIFNYKFNHYKNKK